MKKANVFGFLAAVLCTASISACAQENSTSPTSALAPAVKNAPAPAPTPAPEATDASITGLVATSSAPAPEVTATPSSSVLAAPAPECYEIDQHRIHTPMYSRRMPLSFAARTIVKTLPNVPLYCHWYDSHPWAFAIFDPSTATVWTHTVDLTKHRWVTTVYQNTTVIIGAPPYGDFGFTITAFGDVPLISLHMKHIDNDPFFGFFDSVFDPGLHATWGKAPGGPAGVVNAGYCDIGRPGPFQDWDFENWH